MRLTLTVCLTVALAAPAFAQTRKVEVHPIPSEQTSILNAPVEYDANGVAKAQYIKAEDLSPEELQALLAEADRVRTYQQITGLYMTPETQAAPSTAQSASAPLNASVVAEARQPIIELYESPTSPEAPNESETVQTHTVVKGDTLHNISKRYGVSITDLQQANGIQGSSIALGQIVTIPAKQTASFVTSQPVSTVTYVTSPESGSYVTRRIVEPVPDMDQARSVTSDTDTIYAVLPKDTLYGISRRTCTQVTALIAANGIINPNDLKPGQALTIPAGHCLTN